MIEHCLSDDFATFLHASHIEALDGGRKSNHSMSQRMISEGAVFNHHDLTKREHQVYFQTCIQRFRSALKNTECKCFFMTLIRQSDREDEQLITDLRRLEQALSARTTNLRLIVVAHDGIQNALGSSIKELGPFDPGTLIRFRSTSKILDGLSFARAWDNMAIKRLLWTNDLELHQIPEDGTAEAVTGL